MDERAQLRIGSGRLVGLVIAMVLAGGCAFTGGGEPNEIALALTSRNPVVSDLELSTAERTRFTRPGEEAMGIPLGMASPSHQITQRFVPNLDMSVAEVASEVVNVASEAGWEIVPGVLDGVWCGDRSVDDAFDVLTVTIVSGADVDSPSVLITLDERRSGCYRVEGS